MPRYDELYERLAQRAINTVAVDLDTFFEDAIALGMSPEAIEEALLSDLFDEGPIFGKFLNNAIGASEGAVMEAGRQGSFVGQITKQQREFLDLSDDQIDALLDGADPEALAEIEQGFGPVVRQRWVAELVNTCHRCLAVHGEVMTAEQWAERGLHPSTIHSGWNTPCHCRLVNEDLVEGREDLVAPLKRVPQKTASGLKAGSRRTVRVALKDAMGSIAQLDKAAAGLSAESKRTLRMLGKVRPTGTPGPDDTAGLFASGPGDEG